MDPADITTLVNTQRAFFNTGRTKDLSFRIAQLKLFRKVIDDNEDSICEALKHDMNKPKFEAYVGEIAMLYNEIDYAIRHVKSWAKPKKVTTPLVHFPGKSQIYSEPLGVVLIIGTWNYPIQLILCPLVGAMAAGNCAILKPSRMAPHTSDLVARIIAENFDPGFIAAVQGGAEDVKNLIDCRLDHVFFTGGTSVGRIIAEAAARKLTPVTLELGGKSPCVVDREVHPDYAARRITWGKFFNAGQTCVAPDYLMVHKSRKREILQGIQRCIKEFYGKDPHDSPDYARIINDRHFDRLSGLLNEGDIILGGKTISAERYIDPTVIDNASWDHKIMQDEIFGPLLPVIEYEDLAQAVSMINQRPKPLSLYFFSTNKEAQRTVLHATSSGGCTINDTIVHLSTQTLPFGGVGDSGTGKYHGQASFDTFSNKKSVLCRSFLVDMPLRYAPYGKKLPMVKKMLKYFG
ncbi:MAG: aldehyde dehydrogenase [Desulfomonilaceae bacterium]